MMKVKLFMILNLLYQCNLVNANTSVRRNNRKPYYNLNYASDLFREFKEKYKKEYSSENENRKRFRIFEQNLKIINEKNKNSGDVYFGITEFTDKTMDEFWKQHTGVVEDDLPKNEQRVPYRFKLNGVSPNIPTNWDWTEHGVVDRPRHQGVCSSCWSFSAAGVIFGQVARYLNKNITLSTQQMIDCFVQGGGCRTGSFPHLAFVHAAKMGGYMSEQTYPYKGFQGKCRFLTSKIMVKLKGGSMRNIKSEEALKNLVYTYGPVSIGVHANQGFVFYTGGIANSTVLQCNSKLKINHAVVLVGFGVERGIPFWKIQNSAGELWGENGFIRIVRGENACNILTYIATANM